jgi:hypothetical protein
VRPLMSALRSEGRSEIPGFTSPMETGSAGMWGEHGRGEERAPVPPPRKLPWVDTFATTTSTAESSQTGRTGACPSLYQSLPTTGNHGFLRSVMLDDVGDSKATLTVHVNERPILSHSKPGDRSSQPSLIQRRYG